MNKMARSPNKEEEEKKKRAQEIAWDCVTLLISENQHFIGIVALKMNIVPVIDSRLRTAATDGTNIFLHAGYFLSLEYGERMFLLAHEIWHCVFLHFLRKGSRDHDLFNYAADLEINFMLEEQNFKVIKFLPHLVQWRGLSAEAIYERLYAWRDTGEYGKRPASSDQHIYPEEEIPESQVKEGEEVVIDKEFHPCFDKNLKRKWRGIVLDTKRQVSHIPGCMSGSLERFIDKYYKPQLNWKEVLQQFVTSCFGGERQWLPPNRRYINNGIYLPSRRTEFLSVFVAIDTSWSTSQDIPQFLSELNEILSSFGRYEITVMQCDAEIKRIDTIHEGEFFDTLDFSILGGGGTAFKPVLKYLEENNEDNKLLIYLTDGYSDERLKAPSYPVLWVITGDGIPPAKWGRVAYLEDDYSFKKE